MAPRPQADAPSKVRPPRLPDPAQLLRRAADDDGSRRQLDEPDNVLTRSYESTDLEGNPVGIEGCNALEFEPDILEADHQPGRFALGLDFQLHQPQHLGFGELATANLKNTTVKLPEGMALNPSAAGGREACSSAQIGLTTAIGQTPIRYREEPQSAPTPPSSARSRHTPLLDHQLPGAVYLAKPFDNPFGSLLAIYLAIEDEESGIIAKLAGQGRSRSSTGQLTTTFQENPQLPLEDVDLHFFGGARGGAETPLSCGTHATAATLTPWSHARRGRRAPKRHLPDRRGSLLGR